MASLHVRNRCCTMSSGLDLQQRRVQVGSFPIQKVRVATTSFPFRSCQYKHTRSFKGRGDFHMLRHSLRQSLTPPVTSTFFQEVDSCSLSDEELRLKIRGWIESILQPFYALNAEERLRKVVEFAQALRKMPVALMTEETREAMYEVPIEFYKIVLSKRLKYSCLYYAEPSFTLEQAEEAMLELYFERAQLKDGQTVLDLGGGWGALAFFIAEKCPASHVTTISYSKSQKEHIVNECRKRGICNVEAIDADLTILEHPRTYDRVLCIELLEHFKNYSELLKKISGWMKPEGLLFVEDFTHRFMPLHLEDTGDEGITSWISKYFIPGATIPSNDLLLYFQDDVSIVDHWIIDGRHYAKTSEDGLKLFDENIGVIFPIFMKVYGEHNAPLEIAHWRAFAIIFAEMFNFNNGQEWIISHYLFTKK